MPTTVIAQSVLNQIVAHHGGKIVMPNSTPGSLHTSNGTPRMLSLAVGNAGLASVFTDAISADEVKIYKTSPRVYGLVSRHLGVPNSAVAFASSISGTSLAPRALGSGPAG